MTEPGKKVAVFAHFGLGDILMMVPALRALVIELGEQDSLTMFLRGALEESVVRRLKWKCQLRCVRLGSGGRKRTLCMLEYLMRYYCGGRRFDVLVAPLMADRVSNALLIKLLLPKFSVGRRGKWMSKIYDVSSEWRKDELQHQVEYYGKTFQSAKLISAFSSDVRLETTPAEEAEVARLLGSQSEELIGFGPGGSANERQKCWPPDFFGKLAVLMLSGRPRTRFCIFGGPEDLALAEEIVAISKLPPDRFLFFLDQPLGVVLAGMRRCGCIVAGTTGLGHMAAASGTRVVVPCVPTNPAESGPYSDQVWVNSASLKCAPCYREDFPMCSEFPCIRLVAPSAVYDSVVAALNHEQPKPFLKRLTTRARGYSP